MKDDSFSEFVMEQLDEIDQLSIRSMFGGAGLYARDKFFAIIAGGRLYFKTDESTRGDYEAYGMEPFRPNAKQTLKNYYEVPVDIIENREEITRWAEKALKISAAERSK